MNIVHVYPIDDTYPHVTEGVGCPCKPDVHDEDAAILIVHHSYDGREHAEQPVKAA